MQLQQIETKIYDIRGQKVMLDFDLAELYEVETKRLKEAVRRNTNHFPTDFMFELTKNEFENLRTQIATSKRGGIRYTPFAFTKQGISMLSSVLNSEKAIKVNISIIRAFVFMIRSQRLNRKLEDKYNKQFKDVYDAINYLLQKDKIETEQKERKRIGFKPDN